MADLEDALKSLDRLTQEEARIALAEVLRITNSIRGEVKVVDGKVEIVEHKVEDIGDRVQDVIDGVCSMSSQALGTKSVHSQMASEQEERRRKRN
jgi:hypothetical protein